MSRDDQQPMSDDDDQAGELRPYPRDRLIESARAAEAELLRRARALDTWP
jgi:hypothetical protein